MKDTFRSKMWSLKLMFDLWWIDFGGAISQWFLLKTANWRIKRSKKLILSGSAYFDWTGDYDQSWEDVDVYDERGRWLPLGFGICSYISWKADNDMNKQIGEPEEPWKDVIDSGNWTTYYTKDVYLEAKHYFIFARKHLKKMLGKELYNKELELKLKVVNQKFLDETLIKQAEWIKEGKPEFKVEFTDRAKKDFKKLLGEEEAQTLFDEQSEKNKKIDEENNLGNDT